MDALPSRGPVSYTHLDVYKRQYQVLAIFSRARAVPPTPHTRSTLSWGRFASASVLRTIFRISSSSFGLGQILDTQALNRFRDRCV